MNTGLQQSGLPRTEPEPATPPQAMLPMKGRILGVDVSMTRYDEAVGAITAAATAKRALSVSALAVHGVMTGVLDAAHRWRLNRLDMVVPDGQPVRWALNLLYGAKLSDRVNGPALTLKVCEAAAALGLPVYFYGSRPEVLEKLTQRLARKYPGLQVAGARPSLFRKCTDAERLAIIGEIRDSGARIVFVGLGCPRQEVWTYENAEAIGVPVIAVGAAFDFHAGLLPQAPVVLQDKGLEWAYRLYQEPRRLWRRYLLLNPLYISLFLLQWSGLSRFADAGQKPSGMEYYA